MITYVIIGITVLVSLACFGNRGLFYKLSLSPYNAVEKKQWYRVLTHAFVHADTMHLLINMLVLWSFGTAVEGIFAHLGALGVIRHPGFHFVLLYAGGILFSSIPDVFRYRHDYHYNSIGASGAVSAVVFASIFFSPWNKIYLMAVLPIPGILFGAAYLWYSQYMNRRGTDNINHNAHFYGAVFGFIYPVLMKPQLIHVFLENITRFNG